MATITLQKDSSVAARPTARKTRWLDVLEREIKRRVGWVDEAVSPFARKPQAQKRAPSVRRAA